MELEAQHREFGLTFRNEEVKVDLSKCTPRSRLLLWVM